MAHGIAFYADGTVKEFEHTTLAEREYAAARLRVVELRAKRDELQTQMEALDDEIENACEARQRCCEAAIRERR